MVLSSLQTNVTPLYGEVSSVIRRVFSDRITLSEEALLQDHDRTARLYGRENVIRKKIEEKRKAEVPSNPKPETLNPHVTP